MTQPKKVLTPEDIYYMQSEVIKWNETFSNSPTDKNLIPTYENLVREEWGGKGEYYESYLAGDLVGRADGIADLIFTGMMLGSLTSVGYQEVDYPWLKNVTTRDDILLKDEVESLNNVIRQVADNLCDKVSAHLPYLLAAESKSMDVRKVFDRVRESNYTKAIHISAAVDIQSEIERIESEGRYAEVFAEINGEWVILRAGVDVKEGVKFEKGKIVKPSSYKSPEDLGGLDEFIYLM